MLAPLAIKVALDPEHTAFVPVMVTIGKVFTVTAKVAVLPTQPAALVPETLYVVETAGVTESVVAFELVFQVYVLSLIHI